MKKIPIRYRSTPFVIYDEVEVAFLPIAIETKKDLIIKFKLFFIMTFGDSLCQIPLNKRNYKGYAKRYPKLKKKMEKLLNIKP